MHDGKAPTGKPVEQRGFTDVRSANNRNSE
jgi:hypothetical protein